MKQFFTLIIILVLTVCCQQTKDGRYTQSEIESLHLDDTKALKIDKDSVLHIDIGSCVDCENFDFTSLVKDMRVIPLETTKESLVGGIYKIIIENKYIYIYDNYKRGGVIIFNHDGKFIRRIPHGKGPGELYRFLAVAFDKQNKQLLIYQHPYMLYYTEDGEYIEQRKTPFVAYNFEVLPDGYIFKTLDGQGNGHLDEFGNQTLFVTDKNFAIKYAGLYYPDNKANYGGYNYLYANDNGIQVTENSNDTIYNYVNGDVLKAAYVMDYEDLKLPGKFWNLNGDEFSNALAKNDYFYFIGEYLETTTHHAFFLRNRYRRIQSVIYRDKETGNIIGGMSAQVDKSQVLSAAFPKGMYGDYFVSVCYPEKDDNQLSNSDILSPESKEAMKNLQEEDNPVIVLFNLKNF